MKILVIRFSSIGDIVLTTPIVRCLKKQLPQNSEIHFLTKPAFGILLEKNPYVDKLWFLKKNLQETIQELKMEGFDQIIDLHNNLRTARIKLSCRVKSTAFHKLNFKKFLLTHLGISRLPKIHIVDRYFETVHNLGVRNDGYGLDYFFPSDNAELKTFLPDGLVFSAMAIGGQHFTKRMPVDKLNEIILKSNHSIILLGGKEDIEIADELERKNPQKVINLVGKLTLHQSAGIVKMSQVLITHDTGMMHIAAALKKKIIVIWGNTIPQFGMYPYYGDAKIEFYNFEVLDLKCRPCSKLGYDKCPKGHFKCMNLQSISTITQTLNSISPN